MAPVVPVIIKLIPTLLAAINQLAAIVSKLQSTSKKDRLLLSEVSVGLLAVQNALQKLQTDLEKEIAERTKRDAEIQSELDLNAHERLTNRRWRYGMSAGLVTTLLYIAAHLAHLVR